MQMAREEVAEVSYCYYSRDSREIVWKSPCLEAAKFTNRDQTFWDVLPVAVAPGKGLKNRTLGLRIQEEVKIYRRNQPIPSAF